MTSVPLLEKQLQPQAAGRKNKVNICACPSGNLERSEHKILRIHAVFLKPSPQQPLNHGATLGMWASIPAADALLFHRQEKRGVVGR